MHSYCHNLFRRLQEPASPSPVSPALRWSASGLAWLYGLGARTRRELYRRQWLKARRLPVPVVSVGNLAVGGTGKTPVTALLARELQNRGRRVAILSRGYGGQQQGVTRLSDGEQVFAHPPAVGEEAYWLARALPGVAVYTGACRFEAGMAARRDLKPDLFLLDDGFQHFQLYRDLDLVLLDASSPFGNGRLLPRGPLREPVSALAAAQVLILTRFAPGAHDAARRALEQRFPGKTLLTAAITPAALRSYPGSLEVPLENLTGAPLYAFAGLARPEVFRRTLVEAGVALRGFQAFPDHHPLSNREVGSLIRDARARQAEALITTGKDWARLDERWEGDLPLWVLEVEARIPEISRILEFLP